MISGTSNKPAAPNAGIASRLAIEHHWPGVGEPERSAYEKTMKILSDCKKWLILLKSGYLFIWVVLLATMTSGCMSWQAESDQNWKQYNPDWKSPTPPDPRPQWGPFAPL